MKFNIEYFYYLFIFLFNIFIVFYYYFELKLDKFIPEKIYKLYIFSSITCILLFLIFIYYLFINDNFNKITINKIYYAIFIMLYSLMYWIISCYYQCEILNILFVLCIIISNIYLLFIVYNINEKKYKTIKNLSIIAILYLLFHHIYIDLFLWNY
jgi:hypothetical protein